MQVLAHPCIGVSDTTLEQAYENGLISLEEIMADLLSVVQYLHSENCAHMGINLENVYYSDRALLSPVEYRQVKVFDDRKYVTGPVFGYCHPQYQADSWNPVEVELYAVARLLYELTLPYELRHDSQWFFSFKTGLNPIDILIQTVCQLFPLKTTDRIIDSLVLVRKWKGKSIGTVSDSSRLPEREISLDKLENSIQPLISGKQDHVDRDMLAVILNSLSLVSKVKKPITFFDRLKNGDNLDLMTFLVKFNVLNFKVPTGTNPFLLRVKFQDKDRDYFPKPSLETYPERRFKPYTLEPPVEILPDIMDLIEMPLYYDGAPRRSIRQVLAALRYNYPCGQEYSQVIFAADTDEGAEALSYKVPLDLPLNKDNSKTISWYVDQYCKVKPDPEFNETRELIRLIFSLVFQRGELLKWLQNTGKQRLTVQGDDNGRWSEILMRVREMTFFNLS